MPCVACLAIALAFKATAGATPPGAKVSVKPAAKAANPPSSKLAPAKPAPGKATPASATPAPPKPKPEPTPPVPPDFLPTMLNGPLAGVEDIVFSVRTPGKNGHWYANFGYFIWGPQMPLYGERGRLCRYNLRTKQLTLLVDDPQGAVRDPQVHYDAKKILFSYRKGGETVYHLYEINVDGSDLRQLTDGAYDDIESTYLPNGDIMLVSARCKRWVNCFLTPVATLHVCDANGMNIRMISSNNEHDNSPWPLPDGRIVYTRWEYVDRSQLDFHHLWTMNPDGTNQAVYFGNMYPSYVMIDAKPIPRTNKVVAVFCPQHGRIEHMGEVRIVDPTKGPDEQGFARRITPADRIEFRDPYPITADCFLVA
ncbi:MAG: hypothetical protein NTW86_26235, partial [Candidatus Sumerlaeota bacterium]|nr:hypothetical protein [Candidatus Sumerlaeota bacterium]